MDKILVIGEENVLAKTLQRTLIDKGLDVNVKAISEKEIKTIGESWWDVIIMDPEKLEPNSAQTLEEIRKIFPYVFILIYTGSQKVEDIIALINLGIDGYINKNEDGLAQLASLIKRKLYSPNIEEFVVSDYEN